MTDFGTLLPMLMDDVAQVAAIDQQQHPLPWRAQSFVEAIEQDWHCRVVKEATGHVLGYSVTRVVGDEAELLNITVRPDVLRRGWGQRLLHDVMDGAASRGALAVFLEVREHNQAAIHLYERTGFTMTGMRKNYYPVMSVENPKRIIGRDHALLMRFSVESTP